MNFFLLTPYNLELDNSLKQLPVGECGAVVSFTGYVRGQANGKKVIALHFEAYEPMVFSELEKIADEIYAKWPVKHVLLHHKTGRCDTGMIPVVAAIASAHRAEAFEACAFLMNRLKQTVPIWKKQIFEDGEVWVSSTP